MLKAKEEGLFFTLPVDEMLQLNTLLFSNFTADKAVFIAKVPSLNDPFLNNWKLNTSQLSTIESDDDFTDTQLLMTQAVDKLMVKARDQIQTIYFYVDIAFEGNKAVYSYFGKDRYEAARNTAPKLHDLMLKIKKAAEHPDYKAELLSKGMNQTMIDELEVTAVELKNKFDNRDEYMSSRKKNTQERKKILNKIWESMSAVNKASKLVYKDDYAKQQQYLLYYPKPKSTEDVNANRITV